MDAAQKRYARRANCGRTCVGVRRLAEGKSLLLCQLRSLSMLRKRYFHYIREGKAYVIMKSVINGGDSVLHELMHYKVEGIDRHQNGAEV